ncbi:unnamed protein product [Citrullus colocynthis]|uniref:Uncharacterized protein n=1 Tax=Citrullus colocynthis TaxID=252529 RepID=A0ABP0Z0T2_9ROSI
MLLLKLLGGQEYQMKFCRCCCVRGLLYGKALNSVNLGLQKNFSLYVFKVLIAKRVIKVASVLTCNELV